MYSLQQIFETLTGAMAVGDRKAVGVIKCAPLTEFNTFLGATAISDDSFCIANE